MCNRFSTIHTIDSLLNNEYERVLWKDLRRAFPFMPKERRQRKNVSAPLNRFRAFRNRVFHNESICWNLNRVNPNIRPSMRFVSRPMSDEQYKKGRIFIRPFLYCKCNVRLKA